MKEFRKYEDEWSTDYVMFCGKSLDEILVSAVSLQEGEWYISQAVWEMDFLPETAEEFYEVQTSHNNDTKGCSSGSWMRLCDIPKEEMSPEHEEIIKRIDFKGVTRTWKVYGAAGHRQRESFCESYIHDFSNEYDGIRIIEVLNSDKTGTNDYSIVKITRNTWGECEDEFEGQLTDGIFENSYTGKIEEQH